MDSLRVAALWLDEGNAHTAEGRGEKLAWIPERGVRIGSYRGDAGMPPAGLMSGLEDMDATDAMGLRSNARLDEAAQALCPGVPKVGGAEAFREFQHAAQSWGTERRVGVKFQVPETKDGAATFEPSSRHAEMSKNEALVQSQAGQRRRRLVRARHHLRHGACEAKPGALSP